LLFLAPKLKLKTKALIPYVDKVFCTIKHHNDYTKSNRNVDYSWTNDGPGGRDDPHHSEFRMVNILSTSDNYNKFGQPPGALTKIKICAQWVDEIFGTGVKVHRNGAQVKNKFEQIEAQFKSAYKWSQVAGGNRPGAAAARLGKWNNYS
jgi:hypothetical protein